MTSEQNHLDQVAEITEQLKQELERLDDGLSINTPNTQWFKKVLADGRKRQIQRMLLDFTLFWIIAIIVFSILTTTVLQSWLLFITFQLLILGLVPWLLLSTYREQVGDQ